MRWTKIVTMAATVAMAGPCGAAGNGADPSATGAVGCLLTPWRVSDLGTASAGIVETIAVERGDTVHAGEALVRLQAGTERASVASARTRALAQAAIDAARAAAELARKKLDRSQDLYRQNFISSLALDQARAESEVADQTLHQAIEQRAAYEGDLGQAQAALSQRVLRSPIDGVVVERMANPGERVELRPLLRVADISSLNVEVVVPAQYFASIAVGARLTVRPDLPHAEPRAARVTQVDRLLDPASNTFRLRLKLPNDGGAIPAGARCHVELPPAAPM